MVKFSPDADWSGTTTFLYSVDDWSNWSEAVEVTIVVKESNSVPEAQPFTQTGDEDTVIVIDGWSYTDADGDVPTAVQITQQPSSGGRIFLDLNGNDQRDDGEHINPSDRISWTDATTNGLVKFIPYEDRYGDFTFTYLLWDAMGYGPEAEATIQVDPVNDAPEITAESFELTPVRMDNTENTGDTVGAIVWSFGQQPFYDRDDPYSVKTVGIAVVGIDNANGTWEYTIDGGDTWVPFGEVSEASATLLASTDPNTRIRFVPDTGWTGTVDAGITFHAWDDTMMGSTGDTGVDLSEHPGVFGVETGIASIEVRESGPYKLRQPDGWTQASDWPRVEPFGTNVALDGNLVIVTAHDGVYAYQWNGHAWDDPQTLLTLEEGSYSVTAVSLDADVAMVVVEGDYESYTQVYRWNGSSWVEEQILPEGPSSVSIDGDFAALGAVMYQWDGASWVYLQHLEEFDLVADPWYADTGFGNSVCIEGDYAIVGAPYEDELGPDAGAAFIYHWDGVAWTPEGKLTALDGSADDRFGYSVSIDEAGYAVVGAPYDDDGATDAGAAYLYGWDGTAWSVQEKVTASDAEARDAFGAAVAIDGAYVVVGAPSSKSSGGSTVDCFAYTYRWDGSSWVEEQLLAPENRWWKQNFGYSVDLDGENIIVGSPSRDAEIGRIGEVYIYGDGTTSPQPPQAGVFSESGDEDTVVVIDGWNYTDANGDAATAVLIDSLPSNGVLFLDSDLDGTVDDGEAIALGQEISWTLATTGGMVKFAPDPSWNGSTTLSYSVKDATEFGPSADATITIDPVNDGPEAGTFSESGAEDTVVVVDGWNYTDADGDDATAVRINSLPSNGVLFLDSDLDDTVDDGETISLGQEISWTLATTGGMVKFAPDPSWNGSTTLSYRVKDATEFGAAADVTITIDPVNDPPDAGLFVQIGDEDSTFVVDGWNYVDPDGDAATALTIERLPSNGILFLDVDGDDVVDADETITVGQEIAWTDAVVNGLVKFEADADWYGPTSLRYSVKDAVAYGNAAAAVIMVYPVNNPPQAGTFTEIGDEDTTFVIDSWNYADRDGDDATTLMIHSLPSNGVLFLDSDGNDTVDADEAISVGQEISWWDATYGQLVKFMPDPDWYGSNSLSYSVKDADEYGAIADAVIEVQHVNTPPEAASFSETGDQGTTLVLDGWNYTDVDGDFATALMIHTLPSNGTFFLDSDNDNALDAGEEIALEQEISWDDATVNQAVKFVPDADWYGTTSLSYSVKDADEYGTIAEATITVEQLNSPPDAGEFAAVGYEDTTFVIDGWNYTDQDGDAAIVLTIESLPSNGVLFLDADGDNVLDADEEIALEQEISWADATSNQLVMFAADADWNGDTFLTYRVKDAEEYGALAEALIVVYPVNDPPVAGPFTEIANRCGVTVVDGWNYTDVDGDSATAITILSLPENGTLFLDADGDNRLDCHEAIVVGQEISWDDATTNGLVKFKPESGHGWFGWFGWFGRCHCSDWYEPGTVTYTVTDGSAYGPSAEGTIVFGSANTPPEAGAFTETGDEGSVIVIDGWNYTDAQGDAAVSLRIYDLPDHGTLFVDRDGDNRVDCGEAIRVGRSIDWDDAAGGMVKFAPDCGWDGTTVFTYSVSDGQEYGAPAEATIVVESWNTPPEAGDFTETGAANGIIVLDGWNYTDEDGHTAVSLRITDLPEHGTLFLDRDGDNRVDCHETIRIGQEISWDDAVVNGLVKFDPCDCWSGDTTLEYQVSDGWDYRPGAVATITVMPKNYRPCTECFTESGIEDTVMVIDGWGIGYDREGDPAVSVTVHSLPNHGTLFLDADNDYTVDPGEAITKGQVITWDDATVNHLVKFAPDADWNGDTKFLHSVNDAWNEGSKAYAHIVVENDNADGPVAGSFTETVTPANTIVVIDGWYWDEDSAHGRTTIEITSLPENGTLFVDEDGDNVCSPQEAIEPGWEMRVTCHGFSETVKFIPDEDWTGSTTFTYKVNSGCEDGTEGQVTIVVEDESTVTTGDPMETDSEGGALLEAAGLTAQGSPYDEDPLVYNGIEFYMVDIAVWGTQEENGYRYRPSGEYNEYIVGTDGDDIIDCSGLNSRYIIFGGSGADYIEGGNLDDYIYGYTWIVAGEDTTHLDEAVDPSTIQTLIGNGGRDYIRGGPQADIIHGDSPSGGSSSSDYIEGYPGNDIIYGDSEYGEGSGADTIDGGEGNDTIYGDSVYSAGSGGDEIKGSDGNDVIWGDSVYGEGTGMDEIWGGAGDDILYGDSEFGQGSGDDEINGGDGNDVLYGDSRVAAGSGADELAGNSGGDTVYGDSMLGPGSGNDNIRGGSGDDILYGDSLASSGSGDDYLFGDDGDDRLYGDTYLLAGSGNDIILGSLGADQLYGDSYEGVGSGNDRLDGGWDNDIVYGDSVNSDGTGNDVLFGDLGDDTLMGDSQSGNGSGTDWLDGGGGSDTMYGDTEEGSGSGNDMLVRGESGEAAADQAEPGDTVITGDVESATYSFEVNGYQAQYREDPDTGTIQVYNYELGQWDDVAERFWDAERNAWITNVGQDVIVEYAGKTIKYENYGTGMWILEDDSWQPYNPDDHYVVDFREDPETGELLVYNNDLGTWDPYMREYTPEGEDYTVYNDGHTILITDSTGCMLSLENYGDGARAKAADSYRWVEFAGDLMYHDAYTNIWYSHGWGIWSYSVDLGETWQEVPMLEISVSTDGNGGTGSVDIFDRVSISHDDAGLQFLDQRYAQSGLHSMDEFAVDLYDGEGYDGEPLVACYYFTAEGDPEGADADLRGSMMNIPNSGSDDIPDPSVVLTAAKIEIFGNWTDKCKAGFEIPNPSSAESVMHPQEPLTVVLQASDLPAMPSMAPWTQYSYQAWMDSYMHVRLSLAPDVVYKRYDVNSYSVAELAEDLVCLQQAAEDAANKEVLIKNLVLFNHDTLGMWHIGGDEVTARNVYEYTESLDLIDTVMVNAADGGQIQSNSCALAGIDPYSVEGFKVETTLFEHPYSLESQSWFARTMLAFLAERTNTTYFASSDSDMWTVKRPEIVVPIGYPQDKCLEFGIGNDWVTVDYHICDWSWLNFDYWRDVEEKSIADWRNAQERFDAPGGSECPYREHLVDEQGVLTGETIMQNLIVQAHGEPGGTDYEPEYKKFIKEWKERNSRS